MKILIVEDEVIIARATKLQLEQSGHNVIGLAKNEETCLSLITKDLELILMDIKLGNNCNGISIAKKLRSQGVTIPILFTTGNSKVFTENETAEIKNCDILNKPIDFSELLNKIGTY